MLRAVYQESLYIQRPADNNLCLHPQRQAKENTPKIRTKANIG